MSTTIEPTPETPSAAVDQAPSNNDASTTTAPEPTRSTTTKPIHSLVLDTGPLIKNEISLSTLINQAEILYTIPAVISEIRDEATRSRLHTTLVPFLKFRSPRPESVKFVSDFARKTGDLAVLSRPDIHLLALTYELECERNGGDWRLRKEPGQKSVNGKAPAKVAEELANSLNESQPSEKDVGVETSKDDENAASGDVAKEAESGAGVPEQDGQSTSGDPVKHLQCQVETLSIEEPNPVADFSSAANPPPQSIPEVAADSDDSHDSDSDGGGWITPSNLKKHQAKDNAPSSSSHTDAPQRTLQAALTTSDYAMQNVALRMNLNLVGGTSCARITHLRTWVLRCHGCFTVTRETDRQFCPSCGQATLTRTACSTDAQGNFRVHLKRNFQYNKRGNVYSIPKPVHGSANGKNSSVSGGGKHGWGKRLILAEDQKEYTKRLEEDKRARYRDVMDEDYMPDLLTGRRTGGHGRPKVGAGRNVNSRKRG